MRNCTPCMQGLRGLIQRTRMRLGPMGNRGAVGGARGGGGQARCHQFKK